MYILYGGDFTRSTLVQWMLEEGKIAYEFRKIDIVKGEHRAAEFLAINPAGLVPVLITPEGEALTEVAALMLYLADRHRLSDLAPTSADPDWGLFLSTVFYIAADIQSEMKRFHFPHRFSLRTEDNLGIQAMAKALVLSRLNVMNTRLAGKGPTSWETASLLRISISASGSHISTAAAYASSIRRSPGYTAWSDPVRPRPPISRRPSGCRTPMRK